MKRDHSKTIQLVADSIIFVSTALGKIVFTSISSDLTSSRKASEKPANANLLAQ